MINLQFSACFSFFTKSLFSKTIFGFLIIFVSLITHQVSAQSYYEPYDNDGKKLEGFRINPGESRTLKYSEWEQWSKLDRNDNETIEYVAENGKDLVLNGGEGTELILKDFVPRQASKKMSEFYEKLKESGVEEGHQYSGLDENQKGFVDAYKALAKCTDEGCADEAFSNLIKKDIGESFSSNDFQKLIEEDQESREFRDKVYSLVLRAKLDRNQAKNAELQNTAKTLNYGGH